MSGRNFEPRFDPFERLSHFHLKSYRPGNSLNRFSVPKYMRIHLDLTIIALLERAIEKKLGSQKHKLAILAVRHDGSEFQAGVLSFTSAL
jgi:hypothetical protein